MRKPRGTWIKGCESAHCVEVQVLKTKVKIRDSKNPQHQLSFSLEEWQQFKEGIIRGAFD